MIIKGLQVDLEHVQILSTVQEIDLEFQLFGSTLNLAASDAYWRLALP